jgi:hypothetical protein
LGAIVVLVTLVSCGDEFNVRRLSPAVGVLAGGEPIDILGNGFSTDDGYTIYFGTSKADNVVVRSGGKLTVTTPSCPEPRKVDVRIITDKGKEYVLPNGFEYTRKGAMDIRDLGQRKSLREQSK